jgi:hypothetical protein
MNFTEIENYLTQKERTVTGVKFETSDEPLVNKDLVDVPASNNWLNLTAITWGFGDDMLFSLTQADGRFVLFVGFFNAFFGKEKSLDQYFFNAIEDAINLIVETLTENAHEEQLEEWLEFEN